MFNINWPSKYVQSRVPKCFVFSCVAVAVKFAIYIAYYFTEPLKCHLTKDKKVLCVEVDTQVYTTLISMTSQIGCFQVHMYPAID